MSGASFTVYPAIDLREGRVVRLRQGDPAAQTVFSDDPGATAQRWQAEGAAWLHVVNLDGALQASDATDEDASRSHLFVNLAVLARIREATGLEIQFGGGVRSLADIELALELGATRVVLGTAAVRDPEFAGAAVRRFGAGCIVVALDARDGRVAVDGWQAATAVSATEAARAVAAQGVARLLFTDIARDGMLSGANVEATARLAQEGGLPVIASGGVAGLADVAALAARADDGIEGVIIGQALYTGALDLGAALAVAGR